SACPKVKVKHDNSQLADEDVQIAWRHERTMEAGMNAPPVLLLSRSAIAKLATTRDYLAAMQTAFADLAHGLFEVPDVGHVPGVGGMFHIKSAQRGGSPALAVIKVNGKSPENVVQRRLPTIQ